MTQSSFNWATGGIAANVATSATTMGYGLAAMTLNGLPGFSDNKTLDGGNGIDTVDYRDNYLAASLGIDASLVRGNVKLGAGVDLLTGIENLGGTDADDTLTGDANANRLLGYGGNDILSGGKGDDILIGGTGNDTYLFNQGDGADTISDYDAKGGNIDLLNFGSGIASDQLWFQHVGNNLEIGVIGTSDKTTIENWYLGSAYQVERIKAGDAKTLANSDVEKLVQAMASFTAPASGTTVLPPAYQTALAPTLAANWH
ncbi:MAG: Bifunctional hemolysin/adenylate cyclase [Herbaspirillum frisingense]|uniref:Bifunctional hemolysin/adenylate cyclase n=1 Tax=Herbaspirillum frisingense TaxID=92645 RepID=A0A7V8JSU7_9BURK|nr:MAG: Bifunctional hemolysin/adenylate cyclase [Herbaspirillum frisingense]